MPELKKEQPVLENSKEKKSPILKIILIALIFILVLMIGFFIFVYINIKPFLMSGNSTNSPAGTPAESYSHPLLTDQQEQILETVGIDVSKLPSSITPAMESCFIEALGQARVDEIKGGVEPGAMDLFKARSCLGQ